MRNRLIRRILILGCFVSFSSLLKGGPFYPVTSARDNAGIEDTVRLDKKDKVPVSSLLIGYNIVYAWESDSLWRDGRIKGYLKEINTRVMRYPGGTVSSFYHWNEPTGEGWKDSWDPQNPVTPKAKSEYMDLDEFIALVQGTPITPLMGINMSSGRRWNRLDDGVKEALALMKYCRDKNFHVTYWYLDNEPYQHDSNGGSKTMEEYAGLVNLFAAKMKEFDPDIKIIVNWYSSFQNRREEYQKLFTIAGKNIDIVDAHWYWSWSKPTFEKWLAKTPMEAWTGESYLAEIAYFRKMVKDFGYPDIKLASLEWNVGPVREKQLSPDQCALIQSEMMMQFMLGGLDMATFWPLQGAGDAVAARSFIRRKDRNPQPSYPVIKFLGKIQGCSLVKSEWTNGQTNLLNLVAVEEREGIARVCLLNKNGRDTRIHIQSDLFKNLKLAEGNTFVLTDQGNGSEIRQAELSTHTAGGISFPAPALSVTMLTFTKK